MALNDITVQANDSVTTSGRVSAGRNLTAFTDQFDNQGQIKVTGDVRIAKDALQSRSTRVMNTGAIESVHNDVRIAATETVNQGTASTISAGHDLTLQGGTLTNNGEVSSQGQTRLTLTQTLTNTGLVSGQKTQITAPAIDNQGQLQALTDLGLTADALQSSGVLIALHDLTVDANATANIGQLSAGQDARLWVAALTQQGDFVAGRDLQIAADSQQTPNTYTHQSGDLEAQSGNLNLVTQSGLTLAAGEHMTAGKQLTVQAAAFNNGGHVSAETGTQLVLDGSLTNRSGGLISGGETDITARAITNQGQLQALTDFNLTTDGLDNTGVLIAQHDLTANVTGHLDNSGQVLSGHQAQLFSNLFTNNGKVVAQHNLWIAKDSTQARNTSVTNTGTIESQQGAIEIASEAVSNGVLSGTDTPNVTGNVENITGTGTHITAGQSLTLQAATLNNAGELSALGQTQVTVDQTLTNQASGLISGQNTVLKAQTITSQGQLQALTDLGLTAQALTNAGVLVAGHDVMAEVAQTLSNGGQMSAGNAISLFTDVLENTGAVTAKNQLLIGKDNQNDILTRNTRVTNTGTIESQQGAIEIASEAVSNGVLSGTDTPNVTGTGTHITAGQSLTLQAATLENNGELSALGNTQVTVDKTLTNQANGLISGQNTVLKAPAMTNQGQLQALTDLGLTTTALDNSGALVALNDITVQANDSVTTSGRVSAGRNLTAFTDQFDNQGQIKVTGDVRIAKDALQSRSTRVMNTGAIESVHNNVRIAATETVNQGTASTISAGHDLTLQGGTLTNDGEVSSQGQTRLTLTQTLTNTGLVSGQKTQITAPAIDNQGQLQALTDLGLTVDALQSSGVLIALHDLTVDAKASANIGQLSAGQDARLWVAALTQQGDFVAGRDLQIAADSQQTPNTYTHQSGDLEAQSGNLNLVTQSGLTLAAGEHMTAGKQLTVQAAAFNNGGHVSAETGTQLVLDGSLTNRSGGLISGGETDIAARAITNQGQLQALTDLGLTAQSLVNSGALVALHDVTTQIAGTLTNHGQMSAGNAVNLFTNVLENSGAVTAKNHLLIGQDNQNDILTRNASVTNTGTIESQQGAIEIASEAVSNGVLSGTDTPNITGNVENITGTGTHITAGQSLTLQAATLNNAGELSALGQTQVTVDQTLTNQASGLISGQNTVLKAQTITSQGQLQAFTDLGLTAQSLVNSGALVALHDVTTQIAGTLTNHGQMSAGNAVNLFTNVLENSGAVTAKNQLLIGRAVAQDETLTRNASVTNTGTIESQQGAIEIASEAVSNGVLSGTGTPNVTGNVTGTGTHITAGQSLTLQAATLKNNGELSALGNTQVTVDKTLTNQTSGLISGQNTVLKAPAMTNQGQLQALTDLGLTTTALDNSGALVALNDITVQANDSVTTSGRVSAGRNLTAFTDQFDNQGQIKVTGDVRIAKDALQSRSTRVMNTGAIESVHNNVRIAATETVNQGTASTISAGHDLTLQGGTLTNNGEVSSQGQTRLTLTQTLTNTGLVSGQKT
ncbi:hypothetical protein P4S72_03940, partial [Vibrio sp. PP-XX7]